MRKADRFATLALIAALAGCARTPDVATNPVPSPSLPDPSKAPVVKPEAPAPPSVAEVPPFAFPEDEFGPMLRERSDPGRPPVDARPRPNGHPPGAGRDAQGARPRRRPPSPPGPARDGADAQAAGLRSAAPRPAPALGRDAALGGRFAPRGADTPPLPVTPRAAVASPDPNRVPIGLIAASPGPARPAVADDSTLERSREATLASALPLRTTPTESARVALPDPDETLHNAAVLAPPPDDDPPAVASRAYPARPPLPTSP